MRRLGQTRHRATSCYNCARLEQKDKTNWCKRIQEECSDAWCSDSHKCFEPKPEKQEEMKKDTEKTERQGRLF